MTNWIEVFEQDKITLKELDSSKMSTIFDGDYTPHVRHAVVDWLIRNNITDISVALLCRLMTSIETDYVKKLNAQVGILTTCKKSKSETVVSILNLYAAFGPSDIREVAEEFCQRHGREVDLYSLNVMVRSRLNHIDLPACTEYLKEIVIKCLEKDARSVTNYMYGSAITRFISLDELVEICPEENLNDFIMCLVNDRSLGEDKMKQVIINQADYICDTLIQYGIGKYAKVEVLVEVLDALTDSSKLDDLLTMLPIGVRILASKELDWDFVQNSLQEMTIRERAAVFNRKDVPFEFMNRNAGVIAHTSLNIK